MKTAEQLARDVREAWQELENHHELGQPIREQYSNAVKAAREAGLRIEDFGPGPLKITMVVEL